MSSENDIVRCECCKSTFEAMNGFENTQQAYGCSAEIRIDSIYGFYGSTVADMKILKFKNGRPENIPEGIVCDECIVNFKDNGLIEVVSNTFW